MKTKLTLEQLKSADFLEIIEKDELESLVGASNPPNSCVFNCFDQLDGDAYNWRHYSYATHDNLHYWAGSGGEVNTSDIEKIGSFGGMYVRQGAEGDVIKVGKDGQVYINDTTFSGGIMTFNVQDGKVGHAVVITGAKEINGEIRIFYYDPSALPGDQYGYVVGDNYSGIYGVGSVGSSSYGGSSNFY